MANLLELPFEEIWILCKTEQPPECDDPQFWADLYKRDFGQSISPSMDSRQAYLDQVDRVALANALVQRSLTWSAFQQLTSGLHLSQVHLRDIWQSGRPSLEQLPTDMLFEIGLTYGIAEIAELCRTSKKLNELLCYNQPFWKTKFLRDYGRIPTQGSIDWREMYFLHNTVSGFGDSESGQLARPSGEYNYPISVLNRTAQQVSCGASHTAVIDTHNNIWMFGNDGYGQLGLGNTPHEYMSKQAAPIQIGGLQYVPIPTRILNMKVQQVSCGHNHTVLIDLNNRVWSFGSNYNGQLGLGDNVDRHSPTPIPGMKAQQVSCGTFTTMLIDLENAVIGFGTNQLGELSISSFSIYNPKPTFAMRNDQKVRARQVSCGSNHSVIIDMEYNVMGTGNSQHGQLGLGQNIKGVDFFTPIPNIQARQVSCGDNHTAIIDLNNRIQICGSSRSGQLGLGDLGYFDPEYVFTQVPTPQALQVACGSGFTVMIDLEHNIWVWGLNESGQLGLISDTENQREPVQVPLTKATQISAGYAHTVFIGYSRQ